MLHLVFNRASNKLKVFVADALQYTLEANGSAWGDGGPNSPYGYQCQMPPGHYKLTKVERIDPPIPSEGAGQIYVADITQKDISALAIQGKARWDGDRVIIGGVSLLIGCLAKYNRSEIMIHAAGSNLGVPACFEPMQPLCRTFGCTRVHNADLAKLMDLLEPQIANGQHIIFSAIGNSPELPQ